MGKASKLLAKSTHSKKKPHRQSPKQDKASGNSSIVIPPRMVTHTLPPTHWPSKIPYLYAALPSQTLTSLQQLTLCPPALTSLTPGSITIDALATYSPTCNSLVQIRPITEPTHPAYPQFGLFAAKALPPGTYIIDYTGLIHLCPQPTCATSDYDLAFLERDASLAIDGASMGNEGRFVNDYHGIRPQGPNALFEEYYVKVKGTKGRGETWQARMGIWVTPSTSRQNQSGNAVEGIAKGEEICVSYGKGWWRARRGLMEESNDQEQEPNLEHNNEVREEVQTYKLLTSLMRHKTAADLSCRQSVTDRVRK